MSDDHRPHLHVTFFSKEQEDPAAMTAAQEAGAWDGIPIFKDVEFVRIKIVGDPKTELVAPANDPTTDPETRQRMTYKERFPRHYEAFKAGQETIDGTPLAELPGITASRIANFKARNVHSIESLAMLDGEALKGLGMGAREMKNQAQAWLDNARSGAPGQAAKENADLKAQLEEMKAKLDALSTGKPDAPAKEEDTVQGGEFDGFDRAMLRQYLKENDQPPKGNPSLQTLLGMAQEVSDAKGRVDA